MIEISIFVNVQRCGSSFTSHTWVKLRNFTKQTLTKKKLLINTSFIDSFWTLVNCFLKHLITWVLQLVVRWTANLVLITFHNVKFVFIFLNNWKQRHRFGDHAHNDSLSLPRSSLKTLNIKLLQILDSESPCVCGGTQDLRDTLDR